MQAIKMLELLNEGKIEEVKAYLRDKIYEDVLKATGKAGPKRRYAAMKKYFTYTRSAREFCQKPAMVEFEGKNYTSFCNSYSLALTTEPCGAIELYTEDNYPNTSRLIDREGDSKEFNFADILGRAKAQGYKLKKSEVEGYKYRYLLKIDNSYFKLGLVESTYNIINDGEKATIYHGDERISKLTIENDIGICLIMALNISDEDVLDNEYIVIEAE